MTGRTARAADRARCAGARWLDPLRARPSADLRPRYTPRRVVQIDVTYRGGLRCSARHAPSSRELETDAPRDNEGLGQSFSPTDLVATALATCVLTTMGIVARRHGWPLEGASARVVKHMVSDPARRIGRLELTLRIPGSFDARARATLERTAHTCPVHQSLAPAVEVPMTFEWDPLPVA
jgi:putative redox protein